MPLRWVMLLVLFLVRLAMGYQFQSVASVSSHLVNDLGSSYAEIGRLIGFFLLQGIFIFFLLPGIFIAIPSGLMTQIPPLAGTAAGRCRRRALRAYDRANP